MAQLNGLKSRTIEQLELKILRATLSLIAELVARLIKRKRKRCFCKGIKIGSIVVADRAFVQDAKVIASLIYTCVIKDRSSRV